jgi:hypothetical protein
MKTPPLWLLVVCILLLLFRLHTLANDTDEPVALPACVQSDCDCSDFADQSQAQQVLDAFPDDRFSLDGDRDGLACESL